MANNEKLPWELVEDILSRVPPKPLARIRTVCKRWNSLFGDKTFINNHKMWTFQFILVTKHKIYSVSLNPEIEVRELSLDFPGLISQTPYGLADCNGLLLCTMGKGAVFFNPWLGKTRRIHVGWSQPKLNFVGIGYDNNRRTDQIVYKTLAYYLNGWRIHDLATDAWKDLVLEEQGTPDSSSLSFHSTRAVSLNGSLYWVGYYMTPPRFVIFDFSFSSEDSSIFCDLPSEKHAPEDALVLMVYRRVRFSLLKECHVTKKINIWVTKNSIASRYHRKVKWRNFMEVSIPNLPHLVQTNCYIQPSYFIDEKRGDKKLVVVLAM